ncbi:hypothetical protein O6H91_02G034000 [Diphasiastrum complanatum]|uniref:Uncharacterized protein n=1 Tax=Diphasiastrum complanatum TaxID=34168 RepID=A0ACC2EEH6_DIPCM|nr:hypothetical protein O6H91_02G034000 [Diphasiastrum complanatum]
MKADTPLDCAVFRLTPTRTRFELYVSAGNETEKLASGLVHPFITHLRAVEEQIAQGGYSIRLEPPYGASDGNAHTSTWFSKGTLERFVRFVSTPEVLERASIVEAELMQLEDSLNVQLKEVTGGEHQFKTTGSTGLSSGTKLGDGLNQNKSMCDSLDTGNIEASENSRSKLVRAMEARRFMLQKEQGMAFARALAAGFRMEHIPNLLLFANCFGAVRLQEACLKFTSLCKRRQETGAWLEELEYSAAETASTHSNLNGVKLATFTRNETGFAHLANTKGTSDAWSEVPSENGAEFQPHGSESQFSTWTSQRQNTHSFLAQSAEQGSSHLQELNPEGRGSADWEQAEKAYQARQQLQTHPTHAFWTGHLDISNMEDNRGPAYEIRPENWMLQYPGNVQIPFSSGGYHSDVVHFQRSKASTSVAQERYVQVGSNSNVLLGDGSTEPQLLVQQESYDDSHSLSSVTYPVREEKPYFDGSPTQNAPLEFDSSSATGSIVLSQSDASTIKRGMQRSSSPRRRSSSPLRKQGGRPNVPNIKRSGVVMIKNINYIAPDVLDNSSTTKSRNKRKDVEERESNELRHLQSANDEQMLAKQVESMSIRVQDAIKLFESKENPIRRHSANKGGKKVKPRSLKESGESDFSENVSFSTLSGARSDTKSSNRQNLVDSLDAGEEINSCSEEKLIGQDTSQTNDTVSFPKDLRTDLSMETGSDFDLSPSMNDLSDLTSYDITLPERHVQNISKRILPEHESEPATVQQSIGNTDYSTTEESSALPDEGTYYFLERSSLLNDSDSGKYDQRHAAILERKIAQDPIVSPERIRSSCNGNDGSSSGFDFESGLVNGVTLSQNEDVFLIPERVGELASNHPWNLTNIPDMEQTDFEDDTYSTVKKNQEVVLDESFMVPARVTPTSQLEASQRATVDAEFEHQDTVSNPVNKLENNVVKDDETFATSAPFEIHMMPQRKSGHLPRSRTDHLDYDLQVLDEADKKYQLKDEHQFVDEMSTPLVGHNEKGDGRCLGQQGTTRKERQARLKEMQDVLEKRKAEITAKGAKLPDKPNLLLEAQSRAEKLRAFKANLAKEKQEKEEQERKRLEKLRLERRERIAALKRPGSLGFPTASTTRRSSLPLPIAKGKLTSSSTNLKSVTPPPTPIRDLSSGYISKVKASRFSELFSNQLHPPTITKPKKTGDNILNRSVSTLGNYLEENKGKQTESTRRKSVATSRELKVLPSSLKEDQVSGPLKVSKALLVEPVSQATSKIYPVAKVPQDAKPFLRKGGGIGPGNALIVKKQKASALSDSPKSQGDNNFAPSRKVHGKDAEASEKFFVEDISDSLTIMSTDEPEERAGVGPGLTLIRAPASTAADVINSPLCIENFESKEEEQQESTASVKDNFALKNDTLYGTNSQFSHSHSHENSAPIAAPMNISVVDSESHQKILLVHALSSSEEVSVSRDSKKDSYNVPVQSTASQLDYCEAGCHEKLTPKRPESEQCYPLTTMQLSSNSSSASSDSQHSFPHKMDDFQATNKENTTQFTDGQTDSVTYSHQSPKESAKGLKRFLKFGRKSRGSGNKTESSASAHAISEGDEDGNEATKIGCKFPDESALIDGQDGNLKHIKHNEAPVSVLDTKRDAILDEKHSISGGSQLKAPRSFFMLSAFRSKSSDPKTRS